MAYKKNYNEVSYDVIDTLFTYKVNEKTDIRLTIIKWGDNAPKYDLRKWKETKGTYKPEKGLTMDDLKAVKAIAKALEALTVEPADYKPATATKATAKKGNGKAKAVADASPKDVKPASRTRKGATAQKTAVPTDAKKGNGLTLEDLKTMTVAEFLEIASR